MKIAMSFFEYLKSFFVLFVETWKLALRALKIGN